MMADIFGADGIIVLIVVLALLFGGAALPKFARSLGSAKNQFEKGMEASKKVIPAVKSNAAHGAVDLSERPTYPGVRIVTEPDSTQTLDPSGI
jgi:sec-independent protein translocase protein TatA